MRDRVKVGEGEKETGRAGKRDEKKESGVSKRERK